MEHILYPIDFSGPALLAIPFVRAVAARCGAKITLFSVVPPAWNVPPGGTSLITGLDEPEQELKVRHDQIAAEEFAGLVTASVTELGDPAQKIVAYSRRQNVDLIMMPTHGVSGYRRELLGSVTVKVLHEAKCPVWTAAHSESQDSAPIPRAIVCAVDDSPQTAKIMRWAAEFSESMGAELTFLHAMAPIQDAPAPSAGSDIQEGFRLGMHEKLESLRQASGIGGRVQVVVGEAVETVLGELRRRQADLLVIGRGLLPLPLGRLRSKAYAMIQGSPCPTVSV